MPRGRPAGKTVPKSISDEEILKFTNVPTEIAAPYIGWSNQALRAALREGSVPFGVASQPSARQWSYNIIAPALVKYRHGETQAYNPKELEAIMVECVQSILGEKLGLLKAMASAVLS